MTPLQIFLLILGLLLTFLASAFARSMKKQQVTGKTKKFGGKPTWLKITWIDVIYGIAMLVGILAKEIWDSINETGTIKIRWARLLGALIVSPIVYAAVYSRFTQGQVDLIGLAIAFQNGFFWQAVFRSVQAGYEGTHSP